MADERFCTECGRPLSATDNFCPACGANVASPFGDEKPEQGTVVTTVYVDDYSNTLDNVMVLTLIWSVLVMIIGAYLVFCAFSIDALIEQMKSMDYDGTQSMWDLAVSMGITRDTLFSTMILSSVITFVAGISGLVSAYFDHKKERYMVALVSLIVCIIFSAGGLITLAIGIAVLYFLTKCKNVFVS